MPRRTRLLIAVLLVLSACGQSAPTDEGTSSARVRIEATTPAPSASLAPARPEATVRLAAFESCSDFLGHVREEALAHVGPHGIQGGGMVAFARGVAVAGSADAESSTASSGRAAATSAYSETNVQVEGVDEPDIVKTDGNRIFAVAGQHLHALSVSEGAAELEASVPLEGWSQELLLDGDRVLLVSGGGGIEPAFSSRPAGGGETVVVVFDVSDGIREVSRTTLEGSYVSARMVDGVVRIVLASRSDRLEFVVPEGEDDVDEAIRRNREIIEGSSAADWLPDYVLHTPRGTERGKLSTCSTVHHPAEFSGFGMTTVVTIDPAAPVPRESAAVLGDASTVYASPESLYVASMAWPSSPTADVAPQDVLTQIHRFDITGADQASYVASGEVAGSLLNQFSLDEHEGRLRVATTTGFFGGDETSQSGVTILETSGSALVPVGAVAGLGLGERIYAVRFMGDLGYVVTFRQVDPLYVLDLSDPRDPRNVGELKIPGYSAYLHPVSEDRLLGVGQDATESGWTTGTQVSLFDVADPTQPTRLDMVSFEGGHSSAEHDHRSFLYWAPADLAVIPLQLWGEQAPEFSGVVGVGVGEDLRELGRLSHYAEGEDAYAGPILRSLVIGDRLFTISELGIGWADLATFESRGFADFPRPPPPSPEPRPAPEDDDEDDGDPTPEPLPNPGL